MLDTKSGTRSAQLQGRRADFDPMSTGRATSGTPPSDEAVRDSAWKEEPYPRRARVNVDVFYLASERAKAIVNAAITDPIPGRSWSEMPSREYAASMTTAPNDEAPCCQCFSVNNVGRCTVGRTRGDI